MIDRRIAKSDKFASLKSDRSRVLWCIINAFLDVEGRYSGDPRDIKEDCCPRLPYTTKQIAESIIELDAVGLLFLYEVDGQCYIEYSRFEDFQPGLRKDREAPSDIPPYSGLTPENSRTTPALYLSLSLKKVSILQQKQKDGIAFDFNSKSFIGIKEEDKKIWGAAYPKCDIEICLNQMAAWLLADPRRRKSNYKQFIVNWLKREQDHGGTKGQSPSGEYQMSDARRRFLEEKD